MPLLLFPPPAGALEPIEIEIFLTASGVGPDVVVDLDPFDVEIVVEDAVGFVKGPPLEYPDPEVLPPWTVYAGGVLLENANPATITRTLNTEDEAEFSSPKFDPLTASAGILGECQIYSRRGVLMFQGPVLGSSSSSGDGSTSFTARGPYWYFRRRYFGTAGRRNLLKNGSFESGLDSWRAVGTTPAIQGSSGGVGPLTGDAMAVGFVEDGRSAYIVQRRAFRTEFPPGQLVTCAAWVYLYAYTGPAAFGYGLVMSRVVAGKIVRQVNAGIDDSTPRKTWVKLKVAFAVKPFTDGVLDVRLYFPGGVAFWDGARIALMESTGSSYTGNTRGEIAARVIQYAQGGEGKDSVGVGTNCMSSAKIINRNWQHEQHDPIDGAIEELASADDDGFDFDVTTYSRTFTTYHPRKQIGTGIVLRLGRPEDGGNLASYTFALDGATVSNSVVVKAPGDGPDREEGGAMGGSPVLEMVVSAPPALSIGDLDAYAADLLAVNGRIIPVIELVTHAGADDLIHTIDTGSVVTVEIDDGAVQIVAAYRIVSFTIDCRNDTMKLTGNVV